MRQFVDRVSLAAVALALALSAVAGSVLLRSLEVARESAQKVTHTVEVRYAMTTMRAAFNRALSTARGFALQGDVQLRRSYDESVAATWTGHGQLIEMVADNPSQSARVRQIGIDLDAYFAALNDLVAARESGGLEAAVLRAARGTDQVRADALRRLIEEALGEEGVLLKTRLAQEARDQAFASALIISLASLAFVLMVSALLALRRDQARRVRAERELALVNSSLEAAITRRTAEIEEARARIEAMFDAMSDAMNAVDSNWRYTFVSKRAARLLRQDPDALVGRCMWDLYPDLQNSELRAIGDRVMRSGVAAEGEIFLENYNSVWYAYHVAPLGDGLAIYFHDVTRRKRQESQLRDYAERMERLSRRLVTVGEEWRRALSRELHDEFGQSLAALKLALGALARAGTGRRESIVKEADFMVDRLISQVRDHTLELRPALLDDRGLVAALTEYIARQRERGGVVIDLHADAVENLELPPEVSLVAFRLVQEAIHNALRHARCSCIEVEIEPDGEQLRVEVRDDGRGLAAADRDSAISGSSRLGIEGLRERIELVGGRFAIDSRPGFGVVVRASLPLVLDAARSLRFPARAAEP